ncbi:MAG: hypothetical protein GY800_13405 [Planctomycetes bacterium]|nr:hypothetical protein [Planctomycetota bacterium]
MQNRIMFHTVALAATLGTASAAWATDVGLPLYSDSTGKKGSIEVYYEDYQHDAEQLYPSGVSSVEQEEERIVVRMNYYPTARIALYGEIGATDSYTSKGNVPLLGAGLRVKVYNGPFCDLSAFASATYIPETEYHADFQEDSSRQVKWSQEESYSEINGGLTISTLVPLGGQATLMPYGGVMVSSLDGDEDYRLDYYLEGVTTENDGYVEGDGAVSLFAGLGLMLDDTWGVRFEGRFINQTSLSAGMIYSF